MKHGSATRRPITVAATLPPPVDGMTLATSIVVKALQPENDVRVFNWSPGPGPMDGAWRLRKGLRSLTSVLRTAIGRRPRNSTLYSVANSRGGLYYNLLLVAMARLRGYRLILHHQVYSYLHRHDWRMQRLDRWLGHEGTHVVLSEGMEADFRQRYGSRSHFFILPNTIVMLDIAAPSGETEPRGGPFRLGHCSNLSLEKGLAEVLETARELLHQKLDVQLVLAGPFVSEREKQLVQQAVDELGRSVDYRGPVYDEDKRKFYRDIDVMLFPTRYQNEAQPLVLAEAMAYGKPVIAFDRACIRSLVGEQGGHVIGEQDSFPEEAAGIVNRWITDTSSWRKALDAVQLRASLLRSEASEALNRFVGFAVNPPTAETADDQVAASRVGEPPEQEARVAR